jgi:putative spermidine/putrescine transport system ATP-binding protein
VADFMGFRNMLEMTAPQASGDDVVVEGEGLRLVGTAVSPVAAGATVVAAVRPEDVRVADADGVNRLDATVEVVEYQGRELAVEVRTDTGRALHLRTDRRLAPGDAVTLTIPPDRLLVYPRSATEPAPAELAKVAR